jgi:cupin 2 domain-containing protein
MIAAGNIFADVPSNLPAEQITSLLNTPHARIERIVSHGHASPPGFWYDQGKDEWVIVLDGAAEILFESEARPRALKRGDYVHIPAHVRHRVTSTDAARPTVWLAVHAG